MAAALGATAALCPVTGGTSTALRSIVANGRLAAGVPEELAQRSALWPLLHTAFDIIELAQHRQEDPSAVAKMYWRVFEAIDIGWLWDAIGTLSRSDRWQTQARSALRDDLLAAIAARFAASFWFTATNNPPRAVDRLPHHDLTNPHGQL